MRGSYRSPLSAVYWRNSITFSFISTATTQFQYKLSVFLVFNRIPICPPINATAK